MAFFNRMHVYSVHVNPASKQPLEDAVFIREGFNKAAFFLHFFWALYHRLWEAAGVFFLSLAIAGAIADTYTKSGDSRTFIMLGIMTIIGLTAHDFRQYILRKRGWITTDLIVAESELQATQRFYDRHLGQHAHSLFQNAPVPAL